MPAQLPERHHRMIHVEHHLIRGGRSFALLLNEIFGCYRVKVSGVSVVLPGLFAEVLRRYSGPSTATPASVPPR